MKRVVLFLSSSFCLAIFLVLIGFAAPGDAEAGKTVFTNRCQMCHGADGHGNPAMAKILKVEFPEMDSEYIQDKKDEEIKETVTNGKGKMAPVQGLSESDLENVIAYLRTFDDED